MKTSARGRKMIEGFEGLRTRAYLDGRGIPTIGYGHTAGVALGDICTQEQADEWLSDDLAQAEWAVHRYAQVALNQNQFDALVSLTFNIGSGDFEHSTVRHKLIQQEPRQAADAFLMWDEINGEASVGLLERREMERDLFLEAVCV